MKKCPNCNNQLIAIDSTGIFSFQKRASRIYWVISTIFLGLLWSILIPKIMSEKLTHIAFAVYYISAILFILNMYKSNMKKIIYECVNCKNKYSNNPLKLFKYGK
jgi:hypothetical protein